MNTPALTALVFYVVSKLQCGSVTYTATTLQALYTAMLRIITSCTAQHALVWHLLKEWAQVNQEDRCTSMLVKRHSSKPSPRKNKNGSDNSQTLISQKAFTNRRDQGMSVCSGWEQGTTDLMSTCTANSNLASLRCGPITQSWWPQRIFCSTDSHMILRDWTYDHSRYLRGTSSMATRRSWRV